MSRSEGPSTLVRLGHFFFKRRKFAFMAVFFAIVFGTRPRLAFGSWSWDAFLDAAGIAVALLGQSLRALVIGLAYIRRGGKDQRVYADTLVQEGFFAHSRNPLYVGNMLVYVGLYLVLNSPWGYIVGIPFCSFVYLCIVLAEEDYLRTRFGQTYEDYCRRVNRFLPSPRGLGRTLGGMKFDWRRLIRKEYGSTFACVSTALGLLVWERYALRGYLATKPVIRAVLLLWAPVILAYATARFLKKTGRLGAS